METDSKSNFELSIGLVAGKHLCYAPLLFDFLVLEDWADKSAQLFSRSSSMDIARNKEGNGMKVLGFIYMTDNNILTFNMTSFIRYDCFNATAELRDCVDCFGLIYRINGLLDTSFEGNYASVWLL